MTTSQIDVPEFAAGFQERLRQQLREGTLSCEGLHRTKNGRIIPVEVTTSTIQFDNQVAVLAILRDITERKALERTRSEFAAAQRRNAQEMEFKNRALSESERGIASLPREASTPSWWPMEKAASICSTRRLRRSSATIPGRFSISPWSD